MFAEFAISFTESLTLRLEGRYSQEDKKAKFLTDFLGISTFDELETDFTYFTPRVSLEWFVTPDNMLYFTVADGVFFTALFRRSAQSGR